jgi:hypothetical protein
MLDEAKAKAFYLGYLGFEVDWESRFNPTAPLYMQIHLGEAIIHLNGHAGENAPASQVNIPVVGLEQYCQYLIAKGADYPKPSVVDGMPIVSRSRLVIDWRIGDALDYRTRGSALSSDRQFAFFHLFSANCARVTASPTPCLILDRMDRRCWYRIRSLKKAQNKGFLEGFCTRESWKRNADLT